MTWREHRRSFCKLVLKEDYKNYENALSILQLETLDSRRKTLTLKFPKTSLADAHFNDLIQKKKTRKGLYTRKKDRQIQKIPYINNAETTEPGP